VKDASVLLLICADTLFGHNQKPNRWAQYDTGAAAENVCLQASSMGLMAHQMGGFDADKARATFNVPERYQILAMVTVGYQAAVDGLSDEDKALLKRFGLFGPPGIAFFNGNGKEMTTLKTVGFQDAERFSTTLARRDSCIIAPQNQQEATTQC